MIRHRHDANRPQPPLIRSSHVVISTINSNLLTYMRRYQSRD
jgi:hypothetical protein